VLFSPTAAGLPTSDYASTDHGYVVGVFTQPERTPITVWLQINSNAPYLRVKWAEGVHLVDGEELAQGAEGVSVPALEDRARGGWVRVRGLSRRARLV
jgi:hypothetical protein